MTLRELHSEHGERYAKILRDPAYQAVLAYLNVEKLNNITALPDEVIDQHSKTILGDLRGHMKHEYDLMTILERKELDLSQLPEETYEDDQPPSKPRKKAR